VFGTDISTEVERSSVVRWHRRTWFRDQPRNHWRIGRLVRGRSRYWIKFSMAERHFGDSTD